MALAPHAESPLLLTLRHSQPAASPNQSQARTCGALTAPQPGSNLDQHTTSGLDPARELSSRHCLTLADCSLQGTSPGRDAPMHTQSRAFAPAVVTLGPDGCDSPAAPLQAVASSCSAAAAHEHAWCKHHLQATFLLAPGRQRFSGLS